MKFSVVLSFYVTMLCRGEQEVRGHEHQYIVVPEEGLSDDAGGTKASISNRRNNLRNMKKDKSDKSPKSPKSPKSEKSPKKKKCRRRRWLKGKKDKSKKDKSKKSPKSKKKKSNNCSEDFNPFFPTTLGEYHTCVGGFDEDLQCWGYNEFGQIGDGSEKKKRTLPTAVRIGKGSIPIEQIVLGYGHTCAIDVLMDLLCWGHNDEGQLGDGTLDDKDTPTKIPLGSGSLSTKKVALGYKHSCAIDDVGQLKCWGFNDKGQVGDGLTESRSAPTAINFVDDSIAVEIALGYKHSCAIDELDGVYCWGSGEYAQIGDGTKDEDRLTPTLLLLGLNTDGDEYKATAIAAGMDHTCVITQANPTEQLMCWGRNHRGQLGDGTILIRRTPVIISLAEPGDDNPAPIAIALGGAHTCAIDELNLLKCWGWNEQGQLGDGTFDDRDKFVVVDLDPDVIVQEIALGRYHSCAMDDNEDMWCWGHNDFGQIGDDTMEDSATPKLILEKYYDSSEETKI